MGGAPWERSPALAGVQSCSRGRSLGVPGVSPLGAPWERSPALAWVPWGRSFWEPPRPSKQPQIQTAQNPKNQTSKNPKNQRFQTAKNPKNQTSLIKEFQT